MEISIKKSWLIGIIISIVVIAIGGIVGYQAWDKKQQEEREQEHLQQSLEKAIDREYKSLVREYKYLAKSYKEASYYSRDTYEKKLKELLGKELYYYPSEPDSEINGILRQKALYNVLLDE